VIFVDTSFWIALRYRDDSRHPAAARLWATATRHLVTTNLVVGETWTLLRSRTAHEPALRFVDAVLASSRTRIVTVDSQLEREAWAWLRRHDERVHSFVDATSFAVMRNEQIHDAFAFDGDFAAAGFVELRP